jgi:exoribonuclease R
MQKPPQKFASKYQILNVRAANAERRSIDRYAASLVADETGHIMAGKVISITGFGAFIELIDHSTEGLIAISANAAGLLPC